MISELADIAEKLKNGRPVEPVTVRTFLWWFGVQRRGYNKVRNIRTELAEAGIETYPDFEDRWVDAPFNFQLSSHPPDHGIDSQSEEAVVTESVNETEVTWISRDPTYRISKLAAANQKVVSVFPDTPFQEVVTLLLARDFSQMPVMTNERIVKGTVSWKSIGSRLAVGQAPSTARDVMDEHHEVRSAQSIFEAIPIIKKFEYVLVSSEVDKITGIVTGSDLSSQFQSLSEPFLLLSEIENSIRNMIGSKFSIPELSQVKDPGDSRTISSVDDLTFGEYLRLLQNPTHWLKLNIPIDRVVFCKDLDIVREIRNDVTHFDPDGVTLDELEKLRDFKAFLQDLSRILTR